MSASFWLFSAELTFLPNYGWRTVFMVDSDVITKRISGFVRLMCNFAESNLVAEL